MRAGIGLAFSLGTACCLFLFNTDAQAITFADGLTHTIDATNSYPFEGALIADGPGSTATTVNVVTGGNIGASAGGTVNVQDTSRLNVTGGTINGSAVNLSGSSRMGISGGTVFSGSTNLSGSSRMEISGGTLSGSTFSAVTANDTSSIRLSGGVINSYLSADGNAVMEIVGGTINSSFGGGVEATGSSTVSISNGIVNGTVDVYGIAAIMNISGGNFCTSCSNPVWGSLFSGAGGTANITGGTFNGFARSNGGQLNMSGGSFGGGAFVSNGGQLSVSGGSFGGGIQTENSSMAVIAGAVWNGDFIALHSSHITIDGSGFNLPLGDVAAISGTLTGTLSDGSPLSVNFGRASTATITLVPEPSTALLLAGGIAVLAVGRRRNSRAALSRR